MLPIATATIIQIKFWIACHKKPGGISDETYLVTMKQIGDAISILKKFRGYKVTIEPLESDLKESVH